MYFACENSVFDWNEALLSTNALMISCPSTPFRCISSISSCDNFWFALSSNKDLLSAFVLASTKQNYSMILCKCAIPVGNLMRAESRSSSRGRNVLERVACQRAPNLVPISVFKGYFLFAMLMNLKSWNKMRGISSEGLRVRFYFHKRVFLIIYTKYHRIPFFYSVPVVFWGPFLNCGVLCFD